MAGDDHLWDLWAGATDSSAYYLTDTELHVVRCADERIMRTRLP